MDISGKQVLLIDDDMSIIGLVRRILENKGMNVIDCTNIDMAIKLYDESNPHLLIVDLDFGKSKISGFDLIKYNKVNKKIPILVISKMKDKTSISKAMAFGADSYLVKPINSNQLLQKAISMVKDYKGAEYIFSFEEAPVEKLEVDANLTIINEDICKINSTVKLKENSEIDLKSDFFNEIGNGHCHFKVKGKSISKEVGSYSSILKILGLNNEGKKEIKSLKKK